MHPKPTIVWFRQDLRLADHPALTAAKRKGGEIIPLFIWSPEEEGRWPLGGASKWWLHHSLASLDQDLQGLKLRLIIRKGKSLVVIQELIKETGADAVFWNRRYEPSSIARDAKINESLHQQKIEVQNFNGALLFEPWSIANKQGKPFQVFTPFWKNCLSIPPPEKPLPAPRHAKPYRSGLKSIPLEDLKLLPRIPWDIDIRRFWKPGAASAKKMLRHFLQGPILYYPQNRDRPDLAGISHLSPYLHFGEISARMIWHATLSQYKGDEEGVKCFLKQLGWREFAHHLLYHFPHTPEQPLRKDFISFPWKKDAKALKAWQKGMTGYPLVDAGMRQLWKIGWMHNRIRMVVGSFLVKDLLISWVEGAKWFWDTLVDADLANNTLGWQWVGGCGADAAPYFRIFNPVAQGEKFDPKGDYIRKWVPELKQVPSEWIHHPWEAPEILLQKAGVILGKTYPYPIVDHSTVRKAALDAFSKKF